MRTTKILAILCVCLTARTLVAMDAEVLSNTRLLESDRLSVRINAARVLGEIGPAAKDATSSLIKCLEGSNHELKHEAVIALGRIGADADHVIPALIPLLADPTPIVKHDTIIALRQFGADARPSLPALVKLLDDKEPLICVSASRAIVEIQSKNGADVPKALSILIAGLKNDHQEVLNEAIHGLVVIGPTAIDSIQELLGSANLKHAEHACDALAAIGSASAPAVDRLISLTSSSDHKLICSAVYAIGEIGRDAKNAVPTLVSLLDHSDSHIAFGAANSLQRIGKAAVPALAAGLNSPKTQHLCAQILAGIGPEASEAVGPLTKLLQLNNSAAQLEAILALASIGPQALSSAPDLLKLFVESRFPNRPAVAFALGKVGAKDAIPQLKDAIREPDNDALRLASLWALLQLDPENDEFITLGVPALTGALRNTLPAVRREAALALGRIGVRAKSAVPELTLRLQDETPTVRRESIVALAEIGSASGSAVAEILRILENGEPAIRPIACYALGRIGEASKPAIPYLKRMLLSRDGHEKTIAAWALVNIAPDPETINMAIPLLATALSEAETPSVRVEVARTLGRIGKGSTLVREALLQAMKDQDEAVRIAAGNATKALGE